MILLVLAKITSEAVGRVWVGLGEKLQTPAFWEMSVQMSVIVSPCFVCFKLHSQLHGNYFLSLTEQQDWKLAWETTFLSCLLILFWLTGPHVVLRSPKVSDTAVPIWGCCLRPHLTSFQAGCGRLFPGLELEELLYPAAGNYELFPDCGVPLSWHLLQVLALWSCHK